MEQRKPCWGAQEEKGKKLTVMLTTFIPLCRAAAGPGNWLQCLTGDGPRGENKVQALLFGCGGKDGTEYPDCKYLFP